MYTSFIKKKRERESAVPDLQMVLGIVYCFSLQASIKTHFDCTHTRGPSQPHTHLSQKRETGWGYSKGYTLAVDYNTHANMGGAGLRNVHRPLGGKALRSGGTEQDGSNPAPPQGSGGNCSFWFFGNRSSLHSPGCPGTHCCRPG